MNIVINTKTVSKHYCFDQQFFFDDCIVKIINDHPEHSFFLIADIHAYKFLSSKNVVFIDSAPISKNIILWKIWYGYKLPAILKKYKAAVFINMDPICSLKTQVPQCVLLPDLAFPDHVSFFKKNIPAFLEKATSIITFSNCIKNEICKQYASLAAEKITVIYNGVNENILQKNEIENTKEKYAEGKEYFLFAGDITTQQYLVNLLKAFSFFKKRQKSNMQLIIATKAFLRNNTFTKSLKTYKYRDDVKLVVDLQEEELSKLTHAAYVFIYALQQTGFYIPILKAMQKEVPVIAGFSPILAEVCEDAVLYTDPAVFENIADKMMILFKDEGKRLELINKGKKLAEKYPLAVSNQLFWQNIVKSAALTA